MGQLQAASKTWVRKWLAGPSLINPPLDPFGLKAWVKGHLAMEHRGPSSVGRHEGKYSTATAYVTEIKTNYYKPVSYTHLTLPTILLV
eukprot:3280601-Amphidinium_carterae.1